MNYYKVTISTMGNVYTQKGRKILKDTGITITLKGVPGEDLKYFIPPTPKKDKDISANGLKSIVLIDTPKSCSECCFQKCLTVYGYACGIAKTMNENTHIRPDWCPLRPLPKRHTAPKTATGYEIGYEDGWKDCLDKITGGE